MRKEQFSASEETVQDEALIREDMRELILHGIVVSRIAGMIASELGLGEEDRNNVIQAGLLHDIGKLKIGNYLYGRKTGDLKVEKIRYIRKHAFLGYEILKKQGYNDMILESVLHHHENFDGSGYPDNLKGEKIPIGARILRVSDVFSALVSDRPYRSAFPTEVAIKLLIDEVKNFDMQCFLALQRVVHTEAFEELQEMIEANNRFALDRIVKKQINSEIR